MPSQDSELLQFRSFNYCIGAHQEGRNRRYWNEAKRTRRSLGLLRLPFSHRRTVHAGRLIEARAGYLRARRTLQDIGGGEQGVVSELENTMAFQFRAVGLKPEREFRFHPSRRWRFDFSFPEQFVAVEVEGGVYSGGRHTRGKGFEDDCEKYNAAVEAGFVVLRYTSKTIKSGEAIAQIERVLAGRRQ